MLIVNSPFPPYSPVEVNFGVPAKVGDASTGTLTNNGTTVWYDDEGLIHRGNDLPAIVGPDGSCDFIVHGVSHRINGYASFYSDSFLGSKGRTYLYGMPLTLTEFNKVNAYSIMYQIPLWVSVLAEKVKFNLPDLGEPTPEIFEAFNNAPAEWVLKIWEGSAKESSLYIHRNIDDFLAGIRRVVQSERKQTVVFD